MQHNYKHIDRDELTGLYHRGVSLKELSQWFRCSTSTITTRLIEYGVKPKTPAKGHFRVRHPVEDLVERYVTRHESVHVISRAIGHSPTYISQQLKAAGVTLRSPKDYRGVHWRGEKKGRDND